MDNAISTLLGLAGCTAAIAICGVAVITFFSEASLQHPITADLWDTHA
jgi:hypothetical protein